MHFAGTALRAIVVSLLCLPFRAKDLAVLELYCWVLCLAALWQGVASQ